MSKRRILFLITDILLIILSVILAFLVRFELQIPGRYFLNIEGIALLAIIITIPIFYFLRLYSFAWAYVSAQELLSLIKAAGLSFLILTASFFVLRDHSVFSGFPRSTLFITYFFIFIFSGILRFSKRIYLQLFHGAKKNRNEKTLIVGAGVAGEQILRSILNSDDSPYLPVGFIDDAPLKQGTVIHGVKVLGKIDDIASVVKDYDMIGGTMIVATPSAGSKIIKRAVGEGRKAGLMKIKVVPPMAELLNGEIDIGMGVLREIEMEDLLQREPIVLDQKEIENFLKNKKILITGAAGSIGSELCRQIPKFNPSALLLIDQDETGIFNISRELEEKFPKLDIKSWVADIRDEIKISQIFKSALPFVIFHAAAYKHVPLMEISPDEAVKNNIFGTKILVENAIKYGAEKFIFISTDKAVNPTSVMGATKRVGEMICQLSNQKQPAKFISVRFGNVLNSRGSVIPIFKEQIDKGGPIKITHKEMKRYFMITREACLLVMQAGAIGKGGEVFVLDMGSPVKIIDLAKELIKRSGFDLDQIKIIENAGIRPGEKLFEDILTAEEGTIATKNDKIFMAKLSNVDEKKLNSSLQKLKEMVNIGDKENIIKTLKELVPFYR